LYGNTDELPNVRVYSQSLPKGNFSCFVGCSWISKNCRYENPYVVKGGKAIKLNTGIEEAPKSIIMIGLLERGKLET